MSLTKWNGIRVYDDTNYKELIGNGKEVMSGGVKRLLSAMPKPAGHNSRLYSKAFGAEVQNFSRNDWSAKIVEQKANKACTSQIQNWDSDNQGSYPTCWAAGTCQAFATARVRMKLPHVYISAMSIAVPISGGHSGGYEGNAVKLFTQQGGVSTDLWGYTDTRDHSDDPVVKANRLLHKSLESYECETFDDFATACLLGFPCTVSYNWWSHVVMLCDLIEIERGSFGFLIRNNWGESYGDKNELGKGGYAIFREGKGTPSGGFAFRQVTASAA